jgi:phosphoribosylamine--glycine ligase
MLTREGPRVIEFNVRLGDPEAQVVLPQLGGPFGRTLFAAAVGQPLSDHQLTLNADRFVGVVLASRGYPSAAETGRPITGLDRAAAVPNALVFHAGTRLAGDRLETAGGRVLTIVGRGASYETAIETAYAAVGAVHFDGMQFRRDIGRKAIAAVAEARA